MVGWVHPHGGVVMRRSTSWAAVFVAFLGVSIGMGAGPASAHSNKSIVRLAVTADRGTVVVRAYLVYTNDHQPVADEFVLAEASANGGTRSFQLRPDVRLPGYFASPAHLTPGRWILHVSAKSATVGSATGAFSVGEAGQLSAVTLSASFDPSGVSKRMGTRSSTGGHGTLLVVGSVFLVLLIVLVARVRATSRRAGRPESDAPAPGSFR